MIRYLTLFMVLLGSLFGQEAEVLPLQPAAEVTEGRSMDQSKSVTVEGSDYQIRSRILGIAMDVREDVYSMLGLNESSQESDLLITLFGEVGERAPERLSKKSFRVTTSQLLLRLDLHLAKGVDQALLERDLTELFLYEVGMREVNLKADEDLEYRLPDWLSLGVLEAVRWEKDKVDRQLYARLYKQNAIYSMQDLLEERALESEGGIMNHAFRVSSGVLVMALLNQPQGKEGLLSLLKEAPSYKGEQKLLISKHFPDTTLSKTSLSKWWSLQLITMSKRPAENLYSITETEKELRKLLRLEVVTNDGSVQGYEPMQYMELKKHSILETSRSVTRAINQLSLLQSKAFPSYRALIGGYQQALIRVIQAPKKKRFWEFFTKEDEEAMSVTEMLIRLEQERVILAKLGERVTDYMNWYQLEKAETPEGAFNDYLQLKKDLENAPVSDGGHISTYLDDIEALYKKD